MVPFNIEYINNFHDIFSGFVQEEDLIRVQLVKNMSKFISKIKDVEIKTNPYNHLIVRREGMKSAALSSFGQGTIKMARIMLEMVKFQNERLMIDEIDAGIHYSRMEEMWRAVLLASDENQVQLFTTTHSKECLDALRNVLESNMEGIADPEQAEARKKIFQNKLRIIRLKEVTPPGKEATIMPFTYTFDQFAFALENETEIR